jgi:hypothetical protein
MKGDDRGVPCNSIRGDLLAVDHVVALVAPFEQQHEENAYGKHDVEAFVVDQVDDGKGGYFKEITHGRPLQDGQRHLRAIRRR